MTKDMSKRITSLFLAFAMLLQILMPQNIFAEGDKSLPQDKYVKVGMIDGKSYDAKIMNELNRIAAKNRKSSPGKPGVRLFSKGPYFGDNNEPKNEDKPKYFGNVSAKLDLKGLDGNAFQWNEIFGVDESGNPKPAQIIFRQMDAESSTDTGLYYMLQITKEGKYTWSDGEGKPTKLPLFSKSLKPYKYEVRIDERVSDKVKLLTEVIFGTEGSSPTFSPENAEGEIIANITLGLTYQQIASTKFKSEWHTDVAEADRPGMKANFAFDDDGYGVSPVSVELPKNDKDTKIIRDWYNEFDPDLVISYYLEKTPDVKIDKTTAGLNFDTANKTVTSGDHKFKYDFIYDVINGGKLTMTEIIPVTFDANGGKFASITEDGADQKIVKEVEYDGTLTDKAEKPTKDRETFKGWSDSPTGTSPVSDDFFKNIKEAKTLYAIWDNNDIVADQLEVKESFKDGDTWVNDFIPTLDQLKGQVKIKDANGKPQDLATGDSFAIVDGTNEYTTDDQLKTYLYDKLKEKDDGNKPSRTETVKAKITHKNGTSQTVDIPIKVVKNIYEAKTLTEKPFYVPDGYVKVTLDPTTKAQDPQKTYYYVNPDAKVVIPGTDPTGTGDNVFTKWLIKGTTDEYKLADKPRHMFTKDTTIEAQYEKEKQGTINIKYVDENGKEIDPKYHKDGVDYPETKEGKLGDYADDRDYPKPGPDFKGYIYSSRESIKGKKYKDPTDPDNLDIVTYKYYKKVTTDTPKNPYVYFPVIFDANGGKFGTDTQKTVYVYFKEDEPDAVKVTFSEVREEVEKAYGKPTKENENFIEWQDKADKGSKVADDYEIKFKGWDSQTYEAIAETFYAHYEQASAFVKYLDLNGKPIADEFKIDGVDYPTEKTGKLGDAIAPDVFTKDTAPKLIGYKFNRIELNPKDGKYALDNKATIKIYYEKLPDVIPEKDGSGNPNEKPDGYVEVKFVPTDKATETTEKIFYVNPKKDVTIPIANPVAIATYTFKEWKMGANADGAVYTPNTAQKFTADLTVITATYEETENIIPYDPSATDPMPRPEGYVRVTFAADTGLKLTEQKAYYVKANAGIILGDKDLVKPKYSEDTGYKFKEWDKEDSLVIEATDILVTAKATKLDKVIPEKDGEGNPNTKPAGYKEVTFVIKDEDKDKGSITGVTKFYVNPTEYVKINPPTTTANTGYEFGAWDKDATIPTVYDKDTTITGTFNGLKDVIPKTKTDDFEKPAGYVTVTFRLQQKFGKDVGKFVEGETTVYYVKPNKDVTIDPPKTSAYVGYKFSSWSPDTTKARMYTMPNTDVLGSFEKIGDFIPSTDKDGKPNPKPEGYVTVIFTDGKYGTITSGKKVYYVNPNANVKMSDLTFARNANRPVVTPDVGYKFNAWLNEKSFVIKDDFEIKEDLLATAEYNPLNDVIPKDKPTGGENDKPKGYITVTFKTTDKAGSVEKVVYVNPEKAVALDSYAPEVKPITGYEFADWDRPIKEKIQYKDKDVITAQFNEIGNVSKVEKPGYVKVEFKQGDHGTLTGDVNLWIKPGVKVTIPAPDVKPNVGYKFDKWDKDLTVKLEAKDSPYEITAGYTDRGNIIPQEKSDGSDRPDGYYTVTFKADANGSLSGTTVYYVKPNTEIDLTNTADAITKNPNVGYTADGGTWSPAITKQQYAADATYTFAFKALDDVIEKIDENTKKPDGYVTVKVVPTDKATDKTEKTYYVNPTKEVTIPFAKPTGKAVSVDASNPKAFTWNFTKWTSDEVPFRTWTDEIKAKFTNDTTVTAQYEQSITDQGTVIADEITVHESFKDGSGNWVNNFIDKDATVEKLKGALKVKGNSLPDGATVTFLDDDGNPLEGDAFKAALYDKLKEKDNDNNPSRAETLKAKVKFKNGEVQNVEIPIKVIKNIYKANTDASKPSYVPDGYVKVTVDPTMKAKDPQKYTYYVNPAAKVVIPGEDPEGTGDNKFVKWTMKADSATDEGADYALAERHKFTEASTITAQYVSDVIPQTGDKKPDTVPANFVEVKFVPTDNGTMEGPKTFWVNPKKAVTIPVKDPVGKQYFTFKEWKIGVNADGAVYNPSTPTKFTDVNGTTITATYTEAKNIIPYDPNEPITKPEGYVRVTFTVDPGLKLTERKAYYVKKNAGITLGNAELVKPNYTEDTGYKFKEWDPKDDTIIVATDIVVTAKATELDPVIPEKDDKGNPNEIPTGYISVKFSTEKDGKIKGTDNTEKIVYVNPNKAVVLKGQDPEVTPNTGFTFAGWDTSIQSEIKYHNNDVIKAKYNAIGDVIPQENPTGSDKPEGYLTVTFDKGEHGTLSGKTVYYVKPNKEVTVPAPTVTPATGYVFKKWDQALTQTFTKDTTITAQYGNKPADPRPTSDYVVTELGVQPKPQDYEKAITPPAGKRIKDVQIVERPNVDKPGKTSATVKVIYEDGSTDQITVPVFVQKKDAPTPELRPYPVPGDCNNTCEQPNAPNAPNQPNQPNQPNVGKDALNTTDHYQYLIGYPDGNFAPNKGMTRAEAATMFTRLLNERPVKWRHYNAGLSDIRPGDWYANTVGYAVQRGIVSGYPDGSFKPNKPITRAEFAAIASRFDALAQGNAISFSDLAPSHWGYDAIRSAATKGWISGYPDNTFRPEQAITRAEVTAITNRMLNRRADLYWIDAHPSEVIRFGDVKRSDWYFEPIMEATMGHDFIRDRDKKTEHWTGINGKSFI